MSNKDKGIQKLNAFFLLNIIFYITLGLFIGIVGKYGMAVEPLHIKGLQNLNILLIVFSLMCLGVILIEISYFILSVNFDYSNVIYKNLPKFSLCSKVLGYILSFYAIRSMGDFNIGIILGFIIVGIFFLIDMFITRKMENILDKEKETDISKIISKGIIDLSNKERENYISAGKIFKRMFWGSIICYSILFKYLFYSLTILICGLSVYFIFVVFIYYRAYCLMFNSNQLLIRFIINTAFLSLTVLVILLVYIGKINSWFSNVISEDELQMLLLIPLAIFHWPARKIYIALYRNKN